MKTSVLNYIATVQPELEKLAVERENFINMLSSKLNGHVKQGMFTRDQAIKIIKMASENPAKVLDYLDVPSYSASFGKISKNNGSSNEYDPLAKFVYGLE